MKFERVKNNRKILLTTVIVFVVILTLIITTSLAKYKVTESIKLASGTINYSPSDLNVMAFYLESDDGYASSDSIPESGYTLNSEESYCKLGDTKLDVTISYDFDTHALSITPMTTKGLKCYLYFDEELCGESCKTILANKTIASRTDFSTILTTDTTGTVYSAEDDDGTSYYFAGAATDNYVKFAGYYWRIIRINGDGTIRLIYAGTSAITNGTSSSDTETTTSDFNSNGDNMYVGYMYTSGEVHGLGTSSTIKGVLDDWYISNLASYTSYIDYNAGFCGDRTPYICSDNNCLTVEATSGGGTGTTETWYGGYIRLSVNKSPVLTCAESSDLYTTSSSSKGNKALTYPIGLITADEVAFAGGVQNTDNTSYYLYTGNPYWTMSPFGNGVGTYVFYVFYSGSLFNSYLFYVNSPLGVRPVINLKANTVFKEGTLGTAESPYEVI